MARKRRRRGKRGLGIKSPGHAHYLRQVVGWAGRPLKKKRL
jgi:hypothetical protein